MTVSCLMPYFQRNRATLYQGDVIDVLRQMPSESVHCAITSPPYWGLRDYGVAGQIGLEATPAAYVERMVEVFGEVRRVLRNDGTLWLNLGDSMSVGSNLLDCLQTRIKGGLLFFTGRATLTVTAQSKEVLGANQIPPDGIFTRLLGVKRVLVKERDNHLGQVLYLLHPESSLRIGPSVAWTQIGQTDAEIVLDTNDHISIIVTEHDLDGESTFLIPSGSLAAEHTEAALTIKEAAEPVAEGIRNGKVAGDTVPLNSAGECLLQVDAVDNLVPTSERLMTAADGLRNFGIAKASEQHLSLTMLEGRLDLTIRSVAHLFISNHYGSLIRYTEVYDKAQQDANERRPKQQLGIPDMVKRALMRDGWICRSSIIWAKPNPMPESVTDRPTKSYEHVFLLSKAATYYYDQEAVREPQAVGRDYATENRPVGGRKHRELDGPNSRGGSGQYDRDWASGDYGYIGTGRNCRDVWTIATQPTPMAHFATFPEALVEPCIKAGTSERGCCPECGAPWVRVVERNLMVIARSERTHELGRTRSSGTMVEPAESKTTGWTPTCTHDAEPVPAVCLDPFAGSGTVLLVAQRLGRVGVGIELNREYADIAARRLSQEVLAW